MRTEGWRWHGLLLWLLLILSGVARAAEYLPESPLPDAAQEARAHALFRQIRCVVCEGQSIDESGAALAHDLRQVVREQVAAGRSDAQITGWMVERYGEAVLMKPPLIPATWLLWFGPFLLLVVGSVWLLRFVRR